MAASGPYTHCRDWPVVTLGDVTTKIGSGATPTGGGATYLQTRREFALVRSQNVLDRRFDPVGLAFISNEQARRLGGAVLEPRDILLNITGDGATFARSCEVPASVLPAYVNQHVAIVRVDQSVADPGFVLSYLTHTGVKQYIESFNAGGSRRAITKGHIESFALPLPPVHEQRAIAHILGTLDDKIELNRGMSETLEALARALFKSWFIDFDSVRAKAEGRDPGLPNDVADLLPDSLTDSRLGEIPTGWGLRRLDEVAQFLNGLALQNVPPLDGRSLPVIKIAQLRAGSTAGADLASADVPGDYVIHDGDVLFSWSGSLECRLWAGGVGALNQHLFKVTSTSHPRWFYYQWICQHLDWFRHIAATKATTMGHIQRHHLSEAVVVDAPGPVRERLDAIFAPLTDAFWRRSVESRAIAQLRDTLLPRLISGEIRIKDAEKIVGTAV